MQNYIIDLSIVDFSDLNLCYMIQIILVFQYQQINSQRNILQMEKKLNLTQKYYSSIPRFTQQYNPILISDGQMTRSQPREERRYTIQREDLNHKDKIPKFIKKLQTPKASNKKPFDYFETTKSLIVSQKQHRFRQSHDLNDKCMYTSTKPKRTPYDYNQKLFNKPSTDSKLKMKNSTQNLTFQNFLEMAKKQKQRNIPTYSLMCSPKLFNKYTHKTQPYILQQLRQTEDTIPQKQRFSKFTTPKAEDFHQVKVLGKGKNGQVYLAVHKLTGFACAMKIIRKKDINRGTENQKQVMKNQLLREIKIQMFMSHPNLIELYCVFSDKQNIYLIQQLGINGQLYELMKKKTRFSEETTALISRQILNGLKAMHDKDIIHRDLKPENIVLIYGIAKLCDFGWSVHCPVQLRSTLCGTPLYLSPQILIGEQYNQKIDVWAFGTLVYELFIGQNPFKIKNRNDLKKIITDQISFAQNFPKRLKSFLQFILKKNVSQRPQASQILKHQFLKKYAELQTSEELANL